MEAANDLIEFYTAGVCASRRHTLVGVVARRSENFARAGRTRQHFILRLGMSRAFGISPKNLYNLGYWNEYEQRDRARLEAATQLDNREMQAAIHGELGWIALQRGEHTRAREWIKSARRLYAQIGNLRGQLIARRYLANIAMAERQWGAARDQLETLLEAIGQTFDQTDPAVHPYLHNQMNIVHDSLGSVFLRMEGSANAERELLLGMRDASTRRPLAVAIFCST